MAKRPNSGGKYSVPSISRGLVSAERPISTGRLAEKPFQKNNSLIKALGKKSLESSAQKTYADTLVSWSHP